MQCVSTNFRRFDVTATDAGKRTREAAHQPTAHKHESPCVPACAAGRRVALFLPSLAGGGAERRMLEVARLLTRAGLAVDLIVTRRGGAWWESVSPPTRLINLNAWKAPTSLPSLVRYIRRERPDAMIATIAQCCATALIAKWFVSREFRLILRQEVHYSSQYGAIGIGIRAMMWVMRGLLHTADAVWSVSSGVANDLRRLAPKAAELVHVVENPVVSAELISKAKLPVAHPWFEDLAIPVVLAAGRLEVEKDYPTLLRAFTAVVKRRVARLVVLGDGSEKDRLEALSRQLGIRDRVDFAGFQVNPAAYMTHAQVFAMSSLYEGLPGVLIEALACGTSVVSTDCPGGVREVLEDGKWGRLAPVGDASALADRICETIDNPVAPADLVRAASRYSTTATSRRLLGLLEMVWTKT